MTSKKPGAQPCPPARRDGLLVETLGDETVIYDLESKEAHCLKELAAVAFAYVDGTNSSADIAELASYRLGRPVTEVEIDDSLAQLQERVLLSAPPREQRDGLSRREALRTFAAAGAGTVLITTVAAPLAAATTGGSTCKALGSTDKPSCFQGSAPTSSSDFYGCKPCSTSTDCGSGYTCCCVHCDDQSTYGSCCQSVCVAGHTCSGKNGYGSFQSLVSGTFCPSSYCLSYCTDNFKYKCCLTSAGHCCT